MTPLAVWLAGVVPRPLVLPALTLVYAVLIFGLLVLGDTGEVDIAYVDVGRK